MNRMPTGAVLVAAALAAVAPLAGQSDPGRAEFLQWAKRSLHPLRGVGPSPAHGDLAPIRGMVGNAIMVSVSEGVHAGAEPLEFRNRLFQYLVEELGFTAIALESGIVESKVVHDYVRGGPGDLATALAQGITWTFDRLPQNEALVRWIRAYNANPKHIRKVNFYGFDVPGSPGNPMANRAMRTAFEEALRYLDRVDRDMATELRARVASFLPNVHLDPRTAEGPQYPKLSLPERDALTSAVADLVALFERREGQYVRASSSAEYQWAYRGALGARQVDGWLRHIPVGWQPSAGMTFFSESTDDRDRAQADNLSWILDQEGPGGKILVFASRYHLSTMPVKPGFSAKATGNAVAGTYLERRLGDRLVTIGNLIRAGAFGCAGFSAKLEPAPPESFDGLAGELGTPLFLLDLRTAPPDVARWLDRPHRLGAGQGALEVEVGKAFDILFYLDTVTPACPQ